VGIPTDVRDAVVSAYYPRALAVSDAARARAQAAYGISSAIAAALVAAGVFGHLEDRAVSVQVVGVAALVAWLVAAGLFLIAVSRPFQVATATQNSVSAFVHAALDAARVERKKVDDWQKWAAITSAVAALITVVALVLALAVEPPSAVRSATVRVSNTAAAALGALCTSSRNELKVSFDPASLESQLVTMKADPGQCGPTAVDVSLPRAQLLAVAFSK
jgi:hypothetical protein